MKRVGVYGVVFLVGLAVMVLMAAPAHAGGRAFSSMPSSRGGHLGGQRSFLQGAPRLTHHFSMSVPHSVPVPPHFMVSPRHHFFHPFPHHHHRGFFFRSTTVW